ncbi:hypothetical protein QBC34DRAFT_293622 [Podospora aff. communis PSN243]|uniref:Altered inheritance of mitochondria protein 6 n=1 Tax=Podospora aff. communis PSN243 TaxID=3040156 RepID=A0AAV9GU85_9PEZI|nr:hypothetical protein QBC34DRAFT_293622 [Podospora aff. communis PSN243]
MASWIDEKSAARSPSGGGYVALPNGVETGPPQDIASLVRQQKASRRRSPCSYTTMLGLAILFFLVAWTAAPLVEQHLRKIRGTTSCDDGVFDNWGKPGTGTENLAWYPTDFLRDVVPFPCHSHNDYWRKVPFFSAIHAGCIGTEADVWLRNEDLLVGHDLAALQPNRTFQSLYVNPIVEILEHNNPETEFYNEKRRGIFDTDPSQTLILLVDLKTGGAETWPWVMKQLQPLREKGWLSFYQDGKVHERQVTVVGTGNTPFELIVANSNYRDAFFDAPLDKLENSGYNSTNSYYASVSFWQTIGNVWFRGGQPSPDQLAKIRAQIKEAHSRGLYARYWELPPWPIHVRNHVWQILVEEGIDLLNVDDLDGATKEDWTKSSRLFRIR